MGRQPVGERRHVFLLIPAVLTEPDLKPAADRCNSAGLDKKRSGMSGPAPLPLEGRHPRIGATIAQVPVKTGGCDRAAVLNG
jgi:hypothetical protein